MYWIGHQIVGFIVGTLYLAIAKFMGFFELTFANIVLAAVIIALSSVISDLDHNKNILQLFAVQILAVGAIATVLLWTFSESGALISAAVITLFVGGLSALVRGLRKPRITTFEGILLGAVYSLGIYVFSGFSALYGGLAFLSVVAHLVADLIVNKS